MMVRPLPPPPMQVMVHDAQADESRLALTVKELQAESAALRLRLTQQEAEVWSVLVWGGGRAERVAKGQVWGRNGEGESAYAGRSRSETALLPPLMPEVVGDNPPPPPPLSLPPLLRGVPRCVRLLRRAG